MEGEKEVAEEKEEEEEEKKELHHHIAATSSVDYPDLPIMHWEDLSQRIAELEKQEQERRERSKVRHKACRYFLDNLRSVIRQLLVVIFLRKLHFFPEGSVSSSLESATNEC